MIVRSFISDGHRLALAAAILLLVPFTIQARDFAGFVGHANAGDALLLVQAPVALALVLGIVAERAPSAAVLWVTIGQATLGAWRFYRLDFALADGFPESPVAIAATVLGVVAGVGASLRLRARRLAAPPSGPPLRGRVIGALSGLLFAWSVFHDSALAVAIRDLPDASNTLALVWFAAPVGLAFAVVLASLAGARRTALATAVVFTQVVWWGMMPRPEGLRVWPEEDTLGGIVTIFGMSLAVASFVLVRPTRAKAPAPVVASFPVAPQASRAPRNRVSVAAPLLAWVPVLGIVLGHVALRQIRRTGAPGRTSAIVGLALSYPWTLVFCWATLIFWSIHQFLGTATTF